MQFRARFIECSTDQFVGEVLSVNQEKTTIPITVSAQVIT
jgi:hypothetical protein